MDGVDDALADAEGVVQHAGERGEAVGGAACVGDQAVFGAQAVVVDAEDDGVVDGVARRHRQQHPLGPSIKVLRNLLALAEDARGLHHRIHFEFAPRQPGGIGPRSPYGRVRVASPVRHS